MEKKPFTIVVAENDEDDRMILQAGLEAIGCRQKSRFLNSGWELLDYLEQEGEDTEVGLLPNVIILDLNEPDSWRDTLNKIKSNPIFGGIPVVVLTASVEDDDLRDSEPEADALVRKPTMFDKYVEALKTALRAFCETAKR